MILVFEAPISGKAKLLSVLEADPYGNPSFSRNSYKVKEGLAIGQDKGKVFVYMKATDSFAAFAREKLKEVAVECKPEVASAVAKAIEEEESNAEIGFGSIFG
ncbi:MAG: hypothetical protein N3F07_03555 [Candidatus Micrarchaeota archaeon]|nr:hypothetical protein [Candidatus Micrarchaeota archaeon]